MLVVIAAPNAFAAPTNADFVRKIYQDLLQRSPSPADLSTLANALDSATLTRRQAANTILDSNEYLLDRIGAFFPAYLHRPAAAGEPDPFVSTARASSFEPVQAAIVGSAEYFTNRAAGANDQFVRQAYLDLLARPATAGDVSTFVTAITDGLSRTNAASTILTSTEYRHDLIDGLYQSFLHHSADPAALGSFTTLLQSGARDQDVISAILASDEYFNNVPEPDTPLTLLGQAALAAGLLRRRLRPR
jgi:hypothetical protein